MLPPPTTMPIWTPSAVDLGDLAGDERAERRVDAVRAVAEQGLAGQLEQDPLVAQRPPSAGDGRRAGDAGRSSVTAPPRARSGRSGGPGCSRRSSRSTLGDQLAHGHAPCRGTAARAGRPARTTSRAGRRRSGRGSPRASSGSTGSSRSSARLASSTAAGMRVDVDVLRAQAGDLDRQVLDELLELLGAGDEVGLAVDLDEHADPAAGVDVAADEALADVAVGPLRRRPPGHARAGRRRRRRCRRPSPPGRACSP